MKKLYGLLQLLCALMFLTTLTQAQPAQTDTAFVSASSANAKKVYLSAVHSQSHLYNGGQYIDYNSLADEHPYYLSEDWMTGTIIYDGQRYEDVSILYDIWADKVIVEHFTGAFIELVTAKISSFEIRGHSFRKFTKADDSKGAITEGFYDVLYDGKTKVVARHEKLFEETIQSQQLVREFNEKNKYYIIRNGAFFPANSKRAVLQILSDKKKELRKYIRDYALDFRKRETSIVSVAKFYDQQNP